MHNMYIIGKIGVKISVLGANNRNYIVHIIVSGAQTNYIFREYSQHSQQNT